MTPADLEGTVIGPVTHHIDSERIEAFVAATGDEPGRWPDAAPPGYGAALLFAVAGDFLWDPRIAEHTRTLLHVDQRFAHPAPMRSGATASIVGRVDRVRERAGASFVSFLVEAEAGGERVLESASTFLMSSTPAAEPGPDRGEPPATERGPSDISETRSLHPSGELVSMLKSASRADLVRYAAATGDLNPIHWDHAAARTAGVEGVIVHGLMAHAWLAQHAAAHGRGDAPVASIKSRFRSALRPGAPATVGGRVRSGGEGGGTRELSLAVSDGTTDVVTATATIRVG